MRAARLSAAVAAVAGCLLTAVPATAESPPYLAWRGEQVRLVHCDAALAGATTADVAVEAWSGPPTRAPLPVGSPALFAASGELTGSRCVRATLSTLYAGLARIRIRAFDEGGVTIAVHDSLAAWMSLGTPSLVASADATIPGGQIGLVARLSGTLPLDEALGLGPTATLPQDWPALAGRLADEPTAWETHGGRSEDAPLGPFDSERPLATLLADGLLDADDAPMPAARIDVRIAANTGAATDIGGVGSLVEAAKGPLAPPFSAAYLPATTAPATEASGIDGPRPTTFPGFLHNDRNGGVYPFWRFASVLAANVASATRCGADRLTPAGPSRVALYSDEHGEAQATFAAGTGFYFDRLVAPAPSGGCDLGGITVLGTAIVDATARYPYQPIANSDMPSAPVHVDVLSRLAWSLTAFPRRAASADDHARVVLANARDFDGAPFAGRVVCFEADADAFGAQIFDGVVTMLNDDPADDVDLTGAVTVADPDLGRGRVCGATNTRGDVAMELFARPGAVVDVTAEFTADRVVRSVSLQFEGGTPPGDGTGTGTTTTTTGTTATTGPSTTTTATTGPGTTVGTTTTTTTPTVTTSTTTTGTIATTTTTVPPPTAPPPTPTVTTPPGDPGPPPVTPPAPPVAPPPPPAKPARYVVAVSRIVRRFGAGRRLVLRVNGPTGRAAVSIRLVGARGRVLRTVRRTVPANRVVTIAGLALPKAVRTVRVTVVR